MVTERWQSSHDNFDLGVTQSLLRRYALGNKYFPYIACINWWGQKLTLKRCAILSIHRTRCRMCPLLKWSWNNEFFTQIKQILIQFYICVIFPVFTLFRITLLSAIRKTSGSVCWPRAKWLLFRVIIKISCGARAFYWNGWDYCRGSERFGGWHLSHGYSWTSQWAILFLSSRWSTWCWTLRVKCI